MDFCLLLHKQQRAVTKDFKSDVNDCWWHHHDTTICDVMVVSLTAMKSQIVTTARTPV